MKSLYPLLNSLTKGERKKLVELLNSHSSRKREKNKMLLLAELLWRQKAQPDDKQCKERIYGKGAKASKMINLKKRLKGKVLDMLLSDASLLAAEHIDEADLAGVIVRKKLALYQLLLYSKPVADITFELLDEVISISDQYELYPTLLDVLRHKKWLAGQKTGSSEFNRIQERMDECADLFRVVNKAVDYYYEIMIAADYSAVLVSEEGHKRMVSNIADLKSERNIEKSAVAMYYLKMIEFAMLVSANDYEAASEKCKEVLSVIKENKSVYRTQRISVIYNHLSFCESLLGNYENAIGYSKLSMAHAMPGSGNFFSTLYVTFYAIFYDGRYEMAKGVAEKGWAEKNLFVGDFRNARFLFLYAYSLFALGKHKECLKILRSRTELSKDKGGWEVGIRLLAIKCLIELDIREEAGAGIDHLLQHWRRHKKEQLFEPRTKAIIDVLIELKRNDFDFNSSKIKAMSNQLKTEQGLKWMHFTPELIPFHTWLEHKRSAIP